MPCVRPVRLDSLLAVGCELGLPVTLALLLLSNGVLLVLVEVDIVLCVGCLSAIGFDTVGQEERGR